MNLPIVLRESFGSDWAYAGWYQELLTKLGSQRVPVAYYRDNYEDVVYRPVCLHADGGGQNGEMPLPPIFNPNSG